MNARQLFLALLVLLVVLAPVTVEVRRPRMDAATRAAINEFRSAAVRMVASLPNNKGVTADQVTASYNGQLSLSPKQLNTVMVVKRRAERAAWAQMDPRSQTLIRGFFASVHRVV
jgi:hypothetical protein